VPGGDRRELAVYILPDIGDMEPRGAGRDGGAGGGAGRGAGSMNY
jgi:hypothetical protein